MDINTISGHKNLSTTSPALAEISLNDLPKQAAFNAKVLFTNGETVNLKTANGLLKARIEGNPNLKQGSDIMLKVSQNDGQTLVLKVVEQATSNPNQDNAAAANNNALLNSGSFKALPADIQNILSRTLSQNLTADQAGQILKEALANYPNANHIKGDIATVLSELKLNPGFVQGLFNQINTAPDLGSLLSQLSKSLQAMLNNNSNSVLSNQNSQLINQILNSLLAASSGSSEQIAGQNSNQNANQLPSQAANPNQAANQVANQESAVNSNLDAAIANLGKNTTLITSPNSQLNPAAANNNLTNPLNNPQATAANNSALNPGQEAMPKLSLAQTMPLFGQPAAKAAPALAGLEAKPSPNLAADLGINSSLDNQNSSPAAPANKGVTDLNLGQISQNLSSLGLSAEQQNGLIEQIRQIAGQLYPNNNFSLKAANDFIADLFLKISPNLAENSQQLQQHIQELDLRLQVFKEALLQTDLPQKEDLLNLTNKLLQQLEPQRYLPDRLVAMQIPIFDQNQQKTAALYVYKRAGKDRQIDPEDTSILLALQTAHLGRLEALVDIKGRQLAIKMEISATEAIGFLRQQTDSLYRLISEAGYSLINTTVGPLQSLVNNSQQAIAAMDQYRHSFGSKYDFKI